MIVRCDKPAAVSKSQSNVDNRLTWTEGDYYALAADYLLGCVVYPSAICVHTNKRGFANYCRISVAYKLRIMLHYHCSPLPKSFNKGLHASRDWRTASNFNRILVQMYCSLLFGGGGCSKIEALISFGAMY